MNNLNFEGQNIYAGFDVHHKDWKVTIFSEELIIGQTEPLLSEQTEPLVSEQTEPPF